MKNVSFKTSKVRNLCLAGASLAAVLLTAVPGQAQGIKVIAQHRDWTAYSYTENGSKVCFMASAPKKAVGDYTKRGDIYAMVTHRPGEKRWDEVSITTGYTYKKESTVNLTVGSKKYKFFTGGDTAWAYDLDEDRALIGAMIKGAKMVVVGHSSRGTKTTDTYSLSGFSAAYRSINQACGKK